MPYKISKQDGKFCVIKEDDGKSMGCHPSKDKATAQLRALYAQESQGGDPSSLSRRLATTVRAAEEVASFDPVRLEAEIVIIRPGVSDNGVDHTRSAIRQAVEDGIWDGSRMFVDHGEPGKPGSMEKMPFRRQLKDYVSKIKETWVGNEGEARGRVKFIKKDFLEFAQEAKDDIGVSIATWYSGHPERRGREQIWVVDRYERNRSVDWVAFPAAGGAIDKFIPAQESIEVDWDEVTLEDLQAHRPDILEAHRAASESASGNPVGDDQPPPRKVKKSSSSTAPQDGQVYLTAEEAQGLIRTALKDAREQWVEEDSKKATTRTAVVDFVAKSGLTPRMQARVVQQFDGQLEFAEEAVQTAIDAAFDVLEEAGFKRGPRISNEGGSTAPDSTTRTETASREEFIAAGIGDLAAEESRLFYQPISKENN